MVSKVKQLILMQILLMIIILSFPCMRLNDQKTLKLMEVMEFQK